MMCCRLEGRPAPRPLETGPALGVTMGALLMALGPALVDGPGVTPGSLLTAVGNAALLLVADALVEAGVAFLALSSSKIFDAASATMSFFLSIAVTT